ncbi:hypothetical protein ACLB1S_29775 [Escherichia coli]
MVLRPNRGAQTNYTAYNMDAPQKNSVGEFSVGSADGQRQITNVAAGSADTDAVNVGQLKVTDAAVSQIPRYITNLDNRVTNLDSRVTNIENGIGDIVTTGSTKYFKTNTDGVDASAQGKDSVAIKFLTLLLPRITASHWVQGLWQPKKIRSL